MKTVRHCVPAHKKAAVLSERFEKYSESYFLFIDQPLLIESRNNIAEREIRTLVLERMVTQGVQTHQENAMKHQSKTQDRARILNSPNKEILPC